MSQTSFRTVRWMRTTNLVLQAVLFLSLVGGLNYLALHHSWRFDLTAHRRHSLSPETLAYLGGLNQPVQLIVTVERDATDPDVAQAFRDVQGLLREYVNATAARHAGRITVRYLDVYQQRRDAELLGIDRPNLVLALSGDRRRAVGLDEFYVVRDGIKQAFSGEQAITAAILDVSSPARQRIYFLAGHGEMSPDEVDGRRGLSVLADELRLRNFQINTLNLSSERRVPDDAALLVIAGPVQGRFHPYEEGLLRHYASERAGRIILLLPPGGSAGLEDLLYDWGLLADDVLIYESDPAHVTESGDLTLTAFARHPITGVLLDYGVGITLGAARVVRPDPGRSLDESLQITVLAATSPTAWGARDYRLRSSPRFDPAVDLRGQPHLEPRDRLGVAVVSERVAPPKNLPFSVRGGRLIVLGNADLASNNRIGMSGNLAMLLSAVDWCVDRQVRLNTPPRPIERYQLNLSQQDIIRLRYSLLLIVPGIAAVLGLIVYWTRRT
jgi:ABC-type uncharacterized transport system involved in gliding motility auxiliary subunit